MQRKRDSFAAWYMTAQMFILLLAFFFCVSPLHEQKIAPVFMWPAAIALLCLMWYRQRERGALPRDFFILAVFVGWVYGTCVLNKDPYLEINQHYMLAVLLGFGAAYPAFRLFEPGDRQRWVNRFAFLAVTVTTLFALVCLYCSLKGIQLHVPFCDDVLGLKYGRLYVFTLYPTEAGCLFMLGCLLAVYLTTASVRLWQRLLWGFCALCQTLCVAFTVSRTAMICVCVGFGMLAFLLVYRGLKKRKQLPRIAAAALALMVVGYGGFRAMLTMTEVLAQTPTVETQPNAPPSGAMLQTRSMEYDMGSFTGRTDLWREAIQVVRERPATLLIGMSDAQVSQIPQRRLGRDTYHLHSVWFETLLLTGLPGLLLYLFMAAALAIACIRLFFAKSAPLSLNVLAILPAAAMMNALMEIYPSYSGKPMDLIFFLTAGAVVAFQRDCRRGIDHSAQK